MMKAFGKVFGGCGGLGCAFVALNVLGILALVVLVGSFLFMGT